MKSLRTALTFGAAFVVMLLVPTGTATAEQMQTAHDFSFVDIDETSKVDLSAYRGKAILVVNTASFCGFTNQYSGLETLWRKYKERGLVVVGVPSNDFGAQEPKPEAEIKEFCQGAFGITFPLTAKYSVKGPDAHAFYRWVAASTEGRGNPRWNFHKILIGADGRLVRWFASSVRPASTNLTDAIEQELKNHEAPGEATQPASPS